MVKPFNYISQIFDYSLEFYKCLNNYYYYNINIYFVIIIFIINLLSSLMIN